MRVLAHIGNIPVEEYAGFVVPVVLLYVYGRRRYRRDRKALAQLPGPRALEASAVALVLARWADGGHEGLTREHVSIMYPPGPDGVNSRELAECIGEDPSSVGERLDDLVELGYVEVDGDGDGGTGDARCWLTLSGINLLNVTEQALLDAYNVVADRAAASGLPSR